MSKQARFNLMLALLMVLVFALYHFVGNIHWNAAEVIVSLVLFTALMVTYAGMADAEIIARLQEWVGRRTFHVFLPSIGLTLVTWTYIAFAGELTRRALLTTGIYLFVPISLLWLDRKRPQRFTLWNLVAFLIIWWMIEWKLLPGTKIPPRQGLSFFQLVALNIAIFSFLIVRGLEGVGYRLLPNRRDWGRACISLGLFCAFFAIPIGLWTGFIRPTVEWRPFWQFPFILLGIFFFTGIPEEFIFRGILYNLLAKTIQGKHRQWIALAISSVIFGLAHLNNHKPPFIEVHLFGFQYPVPWVYLVLATIAGWFYGLAYIRTGSILAAVLLHTMVDGWWVYFFGGK
ncbi:CPBP family intramembrane metalloprotease [Candidatus Poribacteria bacterium]|nr:CPBP family intramembrane metalloprotease [Candidatus Poribacteria bacterium]